VACLRTFYCFKCGVWQAAHSSCVGLLYTITHVAHFIRLHLPDDAPADALHLKSIRFDLFTLRVAYIGYRARRVPHATDVLFKLTQGDGHHVGTFVRYACTCRNSQHLPLLHTSTGAAPAGRLTALPSDSRSPWLQLQVSSRVQECRGCCNWHRFVIVCWGH
jgi:hypothetical protein